MRRLLLAIMIVLLPLRGWVGDVMAMELVGQALATSAAADPHHAPADSGHAAMMPGDCPGHAAALVDAQPADGAHHGGIDCATCTACQICHSVALTPPSLALAPADLPASTPLTLPHRFVSAERALGFKPPIF